MFSKDDENRIFDKRRQLTLISFTHRNKNDLTNFAAAEESQTATFLSQYTSEASKDSIPVRAPPTVRFPGAAKKITQVAPPEPPVQLTVKQKAVSKKFKPGEWAECLNANLFQWLETDGKTVTEHSPSLPLTYFDEFGKQSLYVLTKYKV